MKTLIQHVTLWSVILCLGMALAGCPPNAYHTLTLNVSPPGAGEIQVSPDRSAYLAGTEVMLEAIPIEGWNFSIWQGTGFNTSSSPTKLRIYQDETITAIFLPNLEGEAEGTEEGEAEGEGEFPGFIKDPGFEEGMNTTAWRQTSRNFATVVCDEARCGMLEGVGPHSGQYWAYFSSTPSGGQESASIEQTVAMPRSDAAFLNFYLAIPKAEGPCSLRVSLEDRVVFEVTELDASLYQEYRMVELDVSGWANGGEYLLRFDYYNEASPGDLMAIFVDDVMLTLEGQGEGEGEEEGVWEGGEEGEGEGEGVWEGGEEGEGEGEGVWEGEEEGSGEGEGVWEGEEEGSGEGEGETSPLCTFTLDSIQMVPPIQSTATGTAEFRVMDEAGNMLLTIQHNVSRPLLALLYSGEAETNGTAIVNLGTPLSPITCVFTSLEYIFLTSHPYYIQISSMAHPNGEIRGQINCDQDEGAAEGVVESEGELEGEVESEGE